MSNPIPVVSDETEEIPTQSAESLDAEATRSEETGTISQSGSGVFFLNLFSPVFFCGCYLLLGNLRFILLLFCRKSQFR